MTTDVVSRTVVIEALSRKAPLLRAYFELLLPLPTYTVADLNTAFRYAIIRIAPAGVSTMNYREWLCDYPSVSDWIRYFSQRVLPFMVRTLNKNPMATTM